MKILITGGAGFLGSRLARTLLDNGDLAGRSIERMVLADFGAPADARLRDDPRVRSAVGDLLGQLEPLFAEPFDAVFHLASAVSGECEANFDLGLRSNLDTTRALLDACRAHTERGAAAPLFFFSSSVAVYGSDAALPLPAVVEDDTLPTPQSSYGIHKFICEQLVADYTRKGYIDGRSARLMTVSVRPGKPNAAASSFLSGIIREPLAGVEAVCPVDIGTAVALASPATTIQGIVRVAEASREAFGGRTAINLPPLTVTVAEMLDALRSVGGAAAAERVRFEPDPVIARIVGGWPSRISSARAARLGLHADSDFASIVRQYLADQATA